MNLADRKDLTYAIEGLAIGSDERLCELAELIDSFPHGCDTYSGDPWITHALFKGAFASIVWMVQRGVDLDVEDSCGYTVLNCALESERPDELAVLELLLKHGAAVNAYGHNGWTPAHMAAMYEDIEALKLLVQYGADLSLPTQIDRYETPREEALRFGKTRALEFFAGLDAAAATDAAKKRGTGRKR